MMRLADHLPDLLTPVRDLYVASILETMAEELSKGSDVDAEPVDRDREGRIRRDGPMHLPSRHDLRIGRGEKAAIRRVPCETGLGFNPVSAPLTEAAAVRISPFTWCQVSIWARGAPGQPNWTPLRLWFLEWFQARFGEESPDLLGVVHRLDGPHDEGGGWRFTVDLGSASVECFAAMLEALGQSGCSEIVVGHVATAP